MGVEPGRAALGWEVGLEGQWGGSALLCERLDNAAVFWELFVYS